MNKQAEHIDTLLPRFLTKLRDMGYSEESSLSRVHRLRRRLRRYMAMKDDMVFCRDMGLSYLASISDTASCYTYAQSHRDVNMLADFLEIGEFRKSYSLTKSKFENYGIGKIAQEFLKELERLGRTKYTIDYYQLTLRYFIDYLKLNGIEEFDQLSIDIVHGFLGTMQMNKTRNITYIRRFFLYIDEEDIYPNDYASAIPQVKSNQSCNKLPSAYNSEEIKLIESSVERVSNVGIRNYAMLILSTRLGLRVSDIANLKFSDIDWDNNVVRLIQQKTNKLIELPLTKDVGESIIAYAKVRPYGNLPYIFLSERPPYPIMKTQSVGTIISGIISKSGVDISKKRHGPHSMRHSLASNMLNKGTPLPVISEVLGHSSTDSTKNYLRIDYNTLLKCTLEVPVVPVEFYNQDGGVLYD